MSLETIKSQRRPIDLPTDKPQVDHVDHGNMERPGAMLHPRAGARAVPGQGWQHYTGPARWR